MSMSEDQLMAAVQKVLAKNPELVLQAYKKQENEQKQKQENLQQQLQRQNPQQQQMHKIPLADLTEEDVKKTQVELDEKIAAYRQRVSRIVPNAEFTKIVQWATPAMISCWIGALFSLFLQYSLDKNSWTETIWLLVAAVVEFSMLIFGACGASGTRFIGVFILIQGVIIGALIWYAFVRNPNKLIYNYYIPENYLVLWILELAEFAAFVCSCIILLQMRKIDTEYNPSRAFQDELENRQLKENERKARLEDLSSTDYFYYDNVKRSTEPPPTNNNNNKNNNRNNRKNKQY